MAFLITQVSPLYCHFAFSDPNIFSGTCSRVVYIQYPFFSVRNYVDMCVCKYVCMYANLFMLILLLARYTIMYVCKHVQVKLILSTLRNYNNITSIQ